MYEKRTPYEVFEEIHEESKVEAPYDPHFLTQIRCEELRFVRQMKMEHQGRKRVKNFRHSGQGW